MKVAVLIPLYNHARYIGAAMESLRAQTRPPDRIIIIDDGSTDGSLNALLTLQEAAPAPSPFAVMVAKAREAAGEGRIETRTDIVMQENAGAHATINRAVAMAADCDFLAVLNSDDCYHPRRIERCLAYLEENPGLDLVCTRLRLIDGNGDTLPPNASHARWFSAAWSYPAGGDSRDLVEWLGLANFPGTTSNFFARAPYLREHLFHDYRFAHDYYALLVAALEGKLGILDAELLDYRIHANNTIATEPERLVREMLRVNLDLIRTLAPRLGAEPGLRAAFTRYQRALWSNVSAVRADLLNFLFCQALALLPESLPERLVATLDGEHFPELREYPNRAILSAHNATAANLGPTGSLADRFYQLKTQLSATKADARPWMEYRQLQAALLDSRWFALGRLLGRARAIAQAGGKTAPEKLTVLRERIAASRWLKLGARLGFSSARKLLALSRSSAQIG